VRHATSA
jgi:hypothetical protein